MKFRSALLSLVLAFAAAGFFMPSHQASAATLTQQDYRWYVNEDSQTETDPWPAGATDLAEDTPITTDDAPPGNDDQLRLRLNVAVSADTLSSSAQFQLQYRKIASCSAGGSPDWENVGEANGAGDWTAYDNSTPADDDQLTDLLLSSSNILESYQEDPPVNTPVDGEDGEILEWDFSLKNNGAQSGAHYCFRMVLLDNGAQPFDGYDNYPELTVKPFIPKSQNWQWFADETDETPVVPFASENTEPIGIREQDPIKLRMTVANTTDVAVDALRYALQWDTSPEFTNPAFVTSTQACGDGSIWCYADGVDTDDDTVTTLLLSDSDTYGRHNESADVSTFTHGASQAAEMEFTIASYGAVGGQTYYFRAYDLANDLPVATGTGETYPSLIRETPTLSFSYEAVEAGTAVGSFTTNVTSTADGVDFGTVLPGEDYIAAHVLRVSEDGFGYQISIFAPAPLQNAFGQTIQGVEGTNALPAPWSFVQTATTTSAFGYHTTDGLLSEGSTRFADDDTWAALTDEPGEIVYTEGTVQDEIHDILYRLNIGTAQVPHAYSTDIYYVVTGTF